MRRCVSTPSPTTGSSSSFQSPEWELDTGFLGSFTDLDEMDGANYARKTFASQTLTKDAPNNRSEFDADDITYTALGAGTRQVAGALIYLHVTNDADSPAIAYIDDGGFPIIANGGDVTIQWNGEGILHFG
ncbi:MAG: hypothetical protein JKX72_12550 [Robiginitomaculum sp.]|nr:hypothetical protein [Robiginitomaculum sp.]